MRKVFYVNGYGVPKDVFADGNYVRYLQRVLAWAETAAAPVDVYFAGGATDPAQPDKTEAGEMERLARSMLHERCRDLVAFHCVTEATDLLGNVRAFARVLPPDAGITMFCEYARQDRVRFLAGRYFPGCTVVPVAFDERMGNPTVARLRELPNSALIIGGWISPLFKRWVTDPLRARHMRRDSARRHARPSP